jgi:glutathione S-transferase
MKLYIMPGACSLAAHIALNWVGASFEVVVLSPEQTSGEEYRRINPKGVVPALVLDDGAVITEALAVLAYVADAYPGAGLGCIATIIVAESATITKHPMVELVAASWLMSSPEPPEAAA